MMADFAWNQTFTPMNRQFSVGVLEWKILFNWI